MLEDFKCYDYAYRAAGAGLTCGKWMRWIRVAVSSVREGHVTVCL